MEILLEEVTPQRINKQGSKTAVNYACWEICPAPALPLSSIKEKKRWLHKINPILNTGRKLVSKSKTSGVPTPNQPVPQHL